jgi:multiple sugar transport system ATP-binding protein
MVPGMAEVVLSSVTKCYTGSARAAVVDLDLTVEDGELLVLLGPSGCGKSTVLRLVAGLEELSSGDLRIGASSVTGVPPAQRDVAMVFQSYALYPHMSVRENIELPLRVRRVAKATRQAKVVEIAGVLGLLEVLDVRPGQLSGGQRQRVAMGRAMVREPSVFLLDEPLSNLDARLRVQMRAEIGELQRRLGTTMIFVTHDQIEAMSIADRVAVMNNGTLQQVGSPDDLYDNPSNAFVAGFIGSPAMNMLSALVTRNARGNIQLDFAGHNSLEVEPQVADQKGLGKWIGQTITMGIRPEHVSLDEREGPTLFGSVQLIEKLGNETVLRIVLVDDDRTSQTEQGQSDTGPTTGTATQIALRFAGRVNMKVGEQLRCAVEIKYLQFFDESTGAALR